MVHCVVCRVPYRLQVRAGKDEAGAAALAFGSASSTADIPSVVLAAPAHDTQYKAYCVAEDTYFPPNLQAAPAMVRPVTIPLSLPLVWRALAPFDQTQT